MKWFVQEVRKWYGTHYRVSCWVDGYLASLTFRYKTEEAASKRAHYMNASKEEQQLIDYAEAWGAWYP
jgi:hypothetical protein